MAPFLSTGDNRISSWVNDDCLREVTREAVSTVQTTSYCFKAHHHRHPQHHYGPKSQQPDPSKEELDHLCAEYYSREVVTCTEDAAYVEAHTRQQSEESLWFQQRRLRLTASNFGKVAKRRDTTLVANSSKRCSTERCSVRQQLDGASLTKKMQGLPTSSIYNNRAIQLSLPLPQAW